MPLISGRQVCAVSGTPVALGASQAFRSITITGETDNTGVVVVGGPDVVAAVLTRKGVPLAAGQQVKFTAEFDDVDDLASLFVDAMVNTDGVNFLVSTAG